MASASIAPKRRLDEPDSVEESTIHGSGKGKWTLEEDDALRRAIETNGNENWKAIAEFVPGRNHSQCLQRWNKVLKPGLIKGNWSPEEDELLKQQIELHGEDAWVKIAEGVRGRTTKQCRERWRNHLAPTINRAPFSDDEIALLEFVYNKIGNRWTQLAKLLPGRAEEDIKKKWKHLHPKQEKKKAGRLPKLEMSDLLNSIQVEMDEGRLPRMELDFSLTDMDDDDSSLCSPAHSPTVRHRRSPSGMSNLDMENEVFHNPTAAILPVVPLIVPTTTSATVRPPAPFLTKKKKNEWDQMSLDIMQQFLFSASFKNGMTLSDMDLNLSCKTENLDDDPIVASVIDSFRLNGSNKDVQSIIDDLHFDDDQLNHLLNVCGVSNQEDFDSNSFMP